MMCPPDAGEISPNRPIPALVLLGAHPTSSVNFILRDVGRESPSERQSTISASRFFKNSLDEPNLELSVLAIGFWVLVSFETRVISRPLEHRPENAKGDARPCQNERENQPPSRSSLRPYGLSITWDSFQWNVSAGTAIDR